MGLYQSKDGVLQVLDKDYEFPDDFKYILDGKLRSPDYDRYCRKNPVDMIIAQEKDIDYLGSGSPFFDVNDVNRLLLDSEPPYQVGELFYDNVNGEPIGFKSNEDGRLELWTSIDAAGNVPNDRDYIIGADIATGTGASNSCISVWDTTTSQMVAGYVNPNIRPEQLAKQMYALAKWFKGPGGPAYMIWEANGPGRNIGSRLRELGFTYVYHREKDDGRVFGKPTDFAGWWTQGNNTQRVLGIPPRHQRADNPLEVSQHRSFGCTRKPRRPGDFGCGGDACSAQATHRRAGRD
jgi:hypothetical protein